MSDFPSNDNKSSKTENEHTYQTIKARPVRLKENYDYFNQKWYRRFFSYIITVIVTFFIKIFIGPVFFGFKLHNKKLLKIYKKQKKPGFILVSNHIHPIDAFLLGTVLRPKRTYFTMLMSNLGLPVVGKLMKVLGGAPIPNKRSLLVEFQEKLNEVVQKGSWVGVYPEAALKPYCNYIRSFKKGAFRFAVDANADIIPMVFVFKKPYGIYRLYKRKPLIQLHVLDRYVITEKQTKGETLAFHTENLQKIMSDYFNKHTNIG